MFCYKNHRLCFGHVSFCIPEGYYLDCELGEGIDSIVRFWAPDKSFTIELRVNTECAGSELELASVLHDMKPTVLRAMEAVSINGLSGHHATYRTRRTQYYEMWMDIALGTALSLLIETPKNIMDIDISALLTEIDLSGEMQETAN